MDKLKYIKLENEDGSYSNSIPLAVDANYVDVNGKDLQDTIGDIDVDKDGSIVEQLAELDSNKINITDIIDNLNSTQTNKVLSANQGKNLKDLVDNIYPGKIEVHCINVGNIKGDCYLISANEKNMIIDFGFDTTGIAIANYLISKDLTKINYAVISHYHGDHVGGNNGEGLLALLNNDNLDFSDCVFYLPNELDSTKWLGIEIQQINTLKELIISTLDSKSISYTNPMDDDKLFFDKNTFVRFLNSSPSNYEYYYDVTVNGNGDIDTGNTSYNNFSIVCELNHINKVFLFTGDIEKKAQEVILPKLSRCDVLKLEHHGANTSTYNPYLKKVKPEIAIVSNMENISTGLLKAKKTLSFIRSLEIPLYSTNDSGNIIIESDGYEIFPSSDNGAVNIAINKNAIKKGINVDQLAVSLVSGDDLNDFTEDGEYRSVSGAITNSLLNCPLTGTGCKLIIEKNSTDLFVRQILIPNNSLDIYLRYKYTTNGTTFIWSDWVQTQLSYLNIPKRINGAVDLNDYTTPGVYWFGNPADLSNAPTTITFRMEVKYINASNRILQIVTPNNLINGEYVEFRRMYTVNTQTSQNQWFDWKKVTYV